MARKSKHRLGNIGAVLKVAETSVNPEADDPIRQKRQLVADLCRLLGSTVDGRPAPSPLPALSPRMRQTLERLLAGDSEKQIANHLGVSKHTVHVYVKALYKGFGVCSRGELLARFVQKPKFSRSK